MLLLCMQTFGIYNIYPINALSQYFPSTLIENISLFELLTLVSTNILMCIMHAGTMLKHFILSCLYVVKLTILLISMHSFLSFFGCMAFCAMARMVLRWSWNTFLHPRCVGSGGQSVTAYVRSQYSRTHCRKLQRMMPNPLWEKNKHALLRLTIEIIGINFFRISFCVWSDSLLATQENPITEKYISISFIFTSACWR